jgi:flagellin
MASMQSQFELDKNQQALSSSFTKLSSGYRVNTAADDAAGLAISESMKAQIRSYVVAERNAGDATSMTQTAEGSLSQVHDILGRMRELAMESANGSLGQTDRSYTDTEFQSLKAEIARIQGSTEFNGNQLLANAPSVVTFQVGNNNTAADQIAVTFGNLNLTALLSASNSVGGATASAALASLSVIDNAIQTVSTSRATYGAVMNRLSETTQSIETMRTNLTAANSRIRDVDVADETAKMSSEQVLTQAGVAVLAQANQIPQEALSLIKGG